MARLDDARLAAGREALRAAGVGDQETAPAVLLPLAGRSPDNDLAIVERLASEPTADRAAALSELALGAERRGWKAVAKQVRRALYRFGQRGIAVPERQHESPMSGRVPLAKLEGYVSPIDGRGNRLLWLVKPQLEGSLVVLTGMLNEPAGLQKIAIVEVTRKQLRGMKRDLQERHQLQMVVADGGYCDALLCEGFARARTAGTTGVGDFPSYRTRLVTGDPVSLEPPLIARVLDVDDRTLSDAVAHGADLLTEPEFASWLLERPTLAPYLSEIAGAEESPLVLSRLQQEERVRSVIAQAIREIFSGSGAAVYRRRLEEMAYYLHASARRAPAIKAAATARALAASTRGGEGIVLCEELVRQSMAALRAEDAERARAESENSLLIRPGAHKLPGGRLVR